MKEIKIAFFDAKPYDRISFDWENINYKYSISYFDSKLTEQTVSLANGFDVVCAFVNDTLNASVLSSLKKEE